MLVRFFSLCAVFLLFSCSVLPKNQEIPSTGFTLHSNLPYETVFEILLSHFSSDYIIEEIDMNKGIIRANFVSTTPKAIVDCGQLINKGVSQNGTPFLYTFKAAESPIYTTIGSKFGHFHNFRKMELHGNIKIQVFEDKRRGTDVNFQIQYDLHKYDNYKLLDEEDVPDELKITFSKHQVVSFANDEIAIFSPEDFVPDIEITEQESLPENEKSNFWTKKRTKSQDANISYSVPKKVWDFYSRSSDSMYCVPNNRIEDSIVDLLKANLKK